MKYRMKHERYGRYFWYSLTCTHEYLNAMCCILFFGAIADFNRLTNDNSDRKGASPFGAIMIMQFVDLLMVNVCNKNFCNEC